MLKKYLWIKNIVFICLFAFLSAQISNRLILSRFPESTPASRSMIPQSQQHRKPSGRKALPYYQVISERNIFNSEYTGPSGTAEPDRDLSAPLRKTELNVRLIGTVVGTPETSFAIIDDPKTKKQELYQLDDIIQDVARITNIDRCKILVLREGREEVLECPEEDEKDRARTVRGTGVAKSPVSDGSDSVRKVSDSEYLIDESEVENALNNINQLMTQIRVVPNFKDGQTNGFKVFAIKPKSIFSKIGLKNGDVIQRINDQEITTPDKAFSAFNVLRNEKSLSVDILRRGAKKSLSYEIR